MPLFTEEQKQFFIDEGYVIVPNFVDQSYIDTAREFLEERKRTGKHTAKQPRKGATEPNIKFGGAAKRASEITDLFYKTGLFQGAEELVGEGNVVLKGDQGQIAYNPPLDDWIEQGKDINGPPPTKKWHIDAAHGKYASLGSDFSLLCGVALSDGQQVDENRGQFTLFPKSHFITHSALVEEIKKNPGGNATNNFLERGADIGKPIRALLGPGDAMFCHQRLAHAPGHNLWTEVRINVYFRVVHAHIDDMLDEQVMSPLPWVGYAGLQDMLPEGVTEFEKGFGGGKKKGNPIKRLLAATGADRLNVEMKLSRRQKASFIRDGYLVLEQAIPEEMIQSATDYIKSSHRRGLYNMRDQNRDGTESQTPKYKNKVRRASEITDMFFKSGLLDACEQFLGDGNAIILDNMADIRLIGPDEAYIEEGMDIAEPHPSKKWRLDHGNGNAKLDGGGDFNMMIVAQMSEGQEEDENRGLFTVWPGSHFATHTAMKEAVEGFDKESDPNVIKPFRKTRLDLGDPVRIPMKPGDVVIAHQRLAHAEGVNLTETTSKVIYFPIVHEEYTDLVEDFVSGEKPFGVFEGIRDLAEEIMG